MLFLENKIINKINTTWIKIFGNTDEKIDKKSNFR